MQRLRVFFILLVFLSSTSGCRLWDFLRNGRPDANIPPMAPVTATPTLESLTWTINRNTASIRSMKAEHATLYVPGAPIGLGSKLYFERPRRLRLQGQAMSLGSRDLDFGSNDQLFWLWTRQMPNEMYFCRHDQFPASPLRSNFPIEPEWIIEALGMVEFRPEEQHSGPFPEPDGNWRIVTQRQTAVGQFTKHTVIDAKMGWVVRQELFSPQNERVALAMMSQHDYDKASGIYFARRVEIQCQGTEGILTVDLGKPVFNMPAPLSASTFEMPQFDGVQTVDICSPDLLYRQGAITPAPTDSWQSGTTPLSQPVQPQSNLPSLPRQPPPVRYMDAGPSPLTMQNSTQMPLQTGPVYSEAHAHTVVR